MANKVIIKSNKKVRKVKVTRNTSLVVNIGGEQPYDVEYGGEEFQQ